MTDVETTTTTSTVTSPPESVDTTVKSETSDSTPSVTMEPQAQDHHQTPKEEEEVVEEAAKKPSSLSLRIWPPTQRTRDAVVNRLIETFVKPSVLSKRYGETPEEEASVAARAIEEEAFGVASAAASAEDDGIEILQVYSKEISKRMLETVKARTAVTADTSNSANVDSGVAPAVTATEDASSASVDASSASVDA